MLVLSISNDTGSFACFACSHAKCFTCFAPPYPIVCAGTYRLMSTTFSDDLAPWHLVSSKKKRTSKTKTETEEKKVTMKVPSNDAQSTKLHDPPLDSACFSLELNSHSEFPALVQTTARAQSRTAPRTLPTTCAAGALLQ
jgi:hypothetical protein